MSLLAQYGIIDELNKVVASAYPVIGGALLVWGAFWAANRLKRGAVEVSDDGWQDAVNDPDACYAHKDGSIRDRKTDEVFFEYKRPPKNWNDHSYLDEDFMKDEVKNDFE